MTVDIFKFKLLPNILTICRNNCPNVFYEKRVLFNFVQYIHNKKLKWNPLFSKVEEQIKGFC